MGSPTPRYATPWVTLHGGSKAGGRFRTEKPRRGSFPRFTPPLEAPGRGFGGVFAAQLPKSALPEEDSNSMGSVCDSGKLLCCEHPAKSASNTCLPRDTVILMPLGTGRVDCGKSHGS